MEPSEKYGLPKPSSDWGRDGNAYAIMGNVVNALKRKGYPAEAIAEYRTESTSGDYDHLLQTAMLWCDEASFGCDEDEELDSEMCEECGETLLFCTCD